MKYLVIGAGGQNIFSYLGALKFLENELKNVVEISGASSGSLISFLLCFNKNIDEIIEFCFKIDQSGLGKLKLKNLFTKFGLIDVEAVKIYLVDLLGSDPTFKELPKKLYVSVYNLTLQKTEYLSRDTYPDMSVLEAVTMSMSIPIMMTSLKYNNCYYIDGGTFEMAPISPFLDKTPTELCIIQSHLHSESFVEINRLKDFITAIFYKCCSQIVENNDEQQFNIINISSLEGISTVDFNIDNDTKWKLFLNSYNTAQIHSGTVS